MESQRQQFRRLYVPVEAGKVFAFIPGTITGIYVKKGSKVNVGDKLASLQAMKMNNNVFAPISGKIKEILVKEGQKVKKSELLIEIE